MARRQPKKEVRAQVAGLVEQAASGNAPWLDQIIRDAGYYGEEKSFRQMELIDLLPGLTRKTLAEWEDRGLPAEKRGRAKLYRLSDFLGWIYRRYVTRGAPGMEDEDGRAEAERRYKNAQAKMQELRASRLAGEMIPREEAEGLMASAVLEATSALMSLPPALAPQLVGLRERDAEALLSERIRRVLSRMSAGEVTVPEAARKKVEALVLDAAKGLE